MKTLRTVCKMIAWLCLAALLVGGAYLLPSALLGQAVQTPPATRLQAVPTLATPTCPPQVEPDPAELVKVAVRGNWNCRAQPFSGADVVAYLSDGLVIELTTTTSNGWTLVYWGDGFPPCWTAGY